MTKTTYNDLLVAKGRFPSSDPEEVMDYIESRWPDYIDVYLWKVDSRDLIEFNVHLRDEDESG
jgi:hypothetical protein